MKVPVQHVKPNGDWCNECTTQKASSPDACSTPEPVENKTKKKLKPEYCIISKTFQQL